MIKEKKAPNYVNPAQLAEEIKRRKAETKRTNLFDRPPDMPPPLDEPEDLDFPPMEEPINAPEEPLQKEESPFDPSATKPLNDDEYTLVRVVLNAVWLNTVLGFGTFAVVGIVLLFIIFDALILQFAAVLLWLLGLAIGYYKVNKNMSPEHAL